MAIALEFFNFVVPIKLIRQKYPGGWEQCLRDHRHLLNGRVWFDEHLFRNGSMGPPGIESLIEEWESRGFECFVQKDGRDCWNEVAVCESGGASLECDWLGFNHETRAAYLIGEDEGQVVYPDRTSERDSR